MRGRTTIAAVIVGVLTVSGCGGDGQTDADVVRKIVVDGGRDPATICDHLSDALLARFATLDNCRKIQRSDRRIADPDLRIDAVVIDGDRATVRTTGKDGRTTIVLVKDDGSWKVETTR